MRPAGLALVALAVLGALVATITLVERGQTIPRSDQAVGAGPTPPEATPSVQAPSRSSVPTGGRLRVVDARSGRALTAATFSPVETEGDWFAPSDRRISCDSEATCEVSSLAESSSWFVHAPGYVPARILRPTSDSVVRLQKADRIDVLVVDELSNPVSGAVVYVYPITSSIRGHVSTTATDAIGAPGSASPTWIGESNARGEAVIDSLPTGRYRLEVEHRCFFAQPHSRVVPSASAAIVELTPLHGVCFEPPPGERIESWRWTLPSGVLRGRDIAAGRRLASEWARAAFPSGVVYLGAPETPEREVVVGCEAILTTGQIARGAWELQPVSEGLNPVFLEPSEFAREVRFDIRDVRGTPVDCTLRVYDAARNARYRTSGTPGAVRLPPGAGYKLSAAWSPQWLDSEFEDAFFDVPEHVDSAPLVVAWQLSCVARRVVITPKPPGEDAGDWSGVAHVSIQDASGEGATVMNWEPDRGPITCLLRPGWADLRVISTCYEDVTDRIYVQDAVDEDAIKVAVRLIAKAQ